MTLPRSTILLPLLRATIGHESRLGHITMASLCNGTSACQRLRCIVPCPSKRGDGPSSEGFTLFCLSARISAEAHCGQPGGRLSGTKRLNLTAYLKANKAEFEFIEKSTTHHATDASRASGIPLDRIVKTIVFVDSQDKPVVGVVRADCKVSRHKLEVCSGLRKLQIASDEAAEKATGFPTGGIPPVGYRKRLPVYLDNRVMEAGSVWCGWGTRTRLMHLKTADIVRLSGGTAADIAIAED